jgi:hypothetical protein
VEKFGFTMQRLRNWKSQNGSLALRNRYGNCTKAGGKTSRSAAGFETPHEKAMA